MPLWASRSTTMVAAMRRSVALLLELVDHDGRGVGQLVAGQAEQLLADDLAGQEAFAAVGQRVFLVEPGLLGQVGLDDAAAGARRRPPSWPTSARTRRRRGGPACPSARARVRRGAARRRACWRPAARACRSAPRTGSATAPWHRPVRSGRPRRRTAPRRRRRATPCTVRLSVRFSAAPWRVWNPGVSTKTNCAAPTVRMPVMRCRVVCALAEVMLIFWPTSAFSSVDLPTFGRPTMATSPQRCGAAGSDSSGRRGSALPGCRRRSGGSVGGASGRVMTAVARRACRWRSGRRACGARPPARPGGANGPRRLRSGPAPARRTRPRRSGHAPGRAWR